MRARGAFPIALLLILAGALAFRLPALDNRPFHGDEAVHAFKFFELFSRGVYRYDPNEFHGPTLYYAAVPLARLHERHNFADFVEQDFRLPIALTGAGLLLLTAPLAGALGRRAMLVSALLLAISPAFVFYSRYYIQEILLALFTLGALVCGWQYARTRRPVWILAGGACGGLMIASKETAVLAFAAAGPALALTPWWTRRVDGVPRRSSQRFKAIGPLLGATVVALLMAILFVSGFFSNHSGPAGALTGPLDYLRAYTPWLKRAGGASQHVYPWHYYLGMLLWTRRENGPVYSEALILVLAAWGMIVSLLPRRRNPFRGSRTLARFLTFYTLLLTLIYSAIPYKTPWCVLSFLTGMALLAGIGAVSLIDAARGRWSRRGGSRRRALAGRTSLSGIVAMVALPALMTAAAIQLGFQSYRASFQAFVDPRNPYVYAQPVPDVVTMGRWVWDVAHYSGQGRRMLVKVIWVDDYHWPIAWYLREFPNIQRLEGFYHDTSDPSAPVILASPEFEDELSKKLDKTHIMVKFFGIRPGVLSQAWVRNDVWERYLKMRPKPRDED